MRPGQCLRRNITELKCHCPALSSTCLLGSSQHQIGPFKGGFQHAFPVGGSDFLGIVPTLPLRVLSCKTGRVESETPSDLRIDKFYKSSKGQAGGVGQHLSETVCSLDPCFLTLPPFQGLGTEMRKTKQSSWDGNEMYLFTTYLCDSRLRRLPLCIT